MPGASPVVSSGRGVLGGRGSASGRRMKSAGSLTHTGLDRSSTSPVTPPMSFERTIESCALTCVAGERSAGFPTADEELALHLGVGHELAVALADGPWLWRSHHAERESAESMIV